MRKFLIAGVLIASSLYAGNPLTSKKGGSGIGSGGFPGFQGGIDMLFGELDELSQGTLSQCYEKPKLEGGFNICNMLPKNDEFSTDICSLAPEIPGMEKKSSKKKKILESDILKKYCEEETKNGFSIGGIGNSGSEVTLEEEEEKEEEKKYKGGSTPAEHYGEDGNGDLKKVLKDKSLANKIFMQDDQNSLDVLDNYSKNSGKAIEEITVDDIVEVLPENKEAYFEERDVLIEFITSDIKTYSPYQVSTILDVELEGKKGEEAKEIKDEKINKAISAVSTGTKERINYLLEQNKKPEHLVHPTKEYVKLMRKDLQLQEAIKVKKQMRDETQVLAKTILEDEKRKNIIYLTGEKALIMNEKFDREKAKAEIDKIVNDSKEEE